MTDNSKRKLCYTGFRDTLELTIGWRELDVIVDAVKEYKEKYKEFDKWTEWTFEGLIEVSKEQER